jgi:hypothetical protein
LLIFGVIGAQCIHLLAMHTPLMQSILKVSPIAFSSWIYTLILSSLIVGVMEIFKMIHHSRRTGRC